MFIAGSSLQASPCEVYSMADPLGASPRPGEKHQAADKADGTRPPKLRRFDMKTRVPRPKLTESAPPGGGPQNPTLLKEELSESGRRAQTSETMSVNMMFRTSFELQQAENCGTNKDQKSSSHQSSADNNIVDKLFQDYVAIKMKEVDDVPGDKGAVALSMEEMNRLLDEEITSIKSRSVVSNLYDEDSEEANEGENSRQGDGDCNDSAQSSADGSSALPNSSGVSKTAPLSESKTAPLSESKTAPLSEAPSGGPSTLGTAAAEVGLLGRPLADSGGGGGLPRADRGARETGQWAGVTAMFEHPPVGSGAKEEAGGHTGGVKVLFGKKPMFGGKKLGVSIGQESLARILGNWKNGKILEEGNNFLFELQANKQAHKQTDPNKQI